MRSQPVAFSWREVDVVDQDGVATRSFAMVPASRYKNVAVRQFGGGGEYILEQVSERSMVAHSHYFATLNDLFHNLPEKVEARFPTLDHFRKFLLIEAGWFDEKEFDMNSDKHAKALGTFIRTNDAYARISIHGKKVIVRTAKSQSMKEMGKEDFTKSKNDVLDLAAQLVGITRTQAIKNGGKAA